VEHKCATVVLIVQVKSNQPTPHQNIAELSAATAPLSSHHSHDKGRNRDATSARVAGKTWWEWVFVTKAGVLHLIRPSRSAAVPREVFGAVRPGVWVSDALGSQRGHVEDWQMCLAHLLRDAQFTIDCNDTAFATPLQRLLLRAIAIGRRRDALKDSTLAQYRADL